MCVCKEIVVKSKALYTEDEKYRFLLEKTWNSGLPSIVFIGINPSDATELIFDKTIMNITNYAINNGFGSLSMVNLFPCRSKDQLAIKDKLNEHHDKNLEIIEKVIKEAVKVVIVWGRDAESKKIYKNAIDEVNGILKDQNISPKCFKDCKGNINCHPSIGYSDGWTLTQYPQY
ncbi:DUF1643 domain-containing protein [Anaerotignum sp.]|uniref:DUF1643 domain-containing protein n=1 Tax=Anaerotignum sp. TaxID=2039241 RepID=UPI00331A3D41